MATDIFNTPAAMPQGGALPQQEEGKDIAAPAINSGARDFWPAAA